MTDSTTRARELLQAATPLPWRYEREGGYIAATVDDLKSGLCVVADGLGGIEPDHDAALIVQAVNAYPALLDVAEALDAIVRYPLLEPQERTADEWEYRMFEGREALRRLSEGAALSKLRESE